MVLLHVRVLRPDAEAVAKVAERCRCLSKSGCGWSPSKVQKASGLNGCPLGAAPVLRKRRAARGVWE